LGDLAEFVYDDKEAAAEWYRSAAEQGHAQSQWRIANLYINGIGTEFNPREAIRWYQAAAENGVPEAQFSLAEFYRAGNHVEQDTRTAMHWYQQSSSKGFEPAAMRIQQYWPSGLFQDRRQEVEDSDKPRPTLHPQQVAYLLNADDPTDCCSERVGDEALSWVYQMIINTAQEHGYIGSELSSVPELQPFEEQLVNFVCRHFATDTATVCPDEMCAAFNFIFRRGFDLTYQWTKSAGAIDRTIEVGNPFDDDRVLTLPYDLRPEIDQCGAPGVICRSWLIWWVARSDDFAVKGFTFWDLLYPGLSQTFRIAVAMALKVFGNASGTKA
jgi:hypothetical protein